MTEPELVACQTCQKPLTHCTCRGANVINERDPDELENLTEEEQEELEEEYEEEEEDEDEWLDDDDSNEESEEEEE